MGLRDQIPLDLQNALRSKNKLELTVLRMLQSAIRNKEIDKNKQELTDEEVVNVVAGEVKKRREAAAEYEKVNRPDAADMEKAEIDILMKYMPRQMSEAEIRAEVKNAIEKTGAGSIKDLGSVMKAVIPVVKGKADGSVVNKVVREELEALQQG